MKTVSKFIFLLIAGLNINAFTLVGSALATYDDSTISVYIGDASCADLDDSPEDLRDLTQKAVDKFWNKVSTSELELDVKGLKNVDSSFYTDQICSSGGTCVPEVDEGVLIVCNSNGTTFSSAGKLAVTLPNNTSGTTLVGSIIAINAISTTKWNDLSENEKISAIAHEIGHAFGLGHSQYKDSLMYASSIEGRKRLGRDDWDGATYLYPKNQGPAAFCGTIALGNKDQGLAAISLALLILIMIAGRASMLAIHKNREARL